MVRLLSGADLMACYRSVDPAYLFEARSRAAYEEAHIPGTRHLSSETKPSEVVPEGWVIVYGTEPEDLRAP